MTRSCGEGQPPGMTYGEKSSLLNQKGKEEGEGGKIEDIHSTYKTK